MTAGAEPLPPVIVRGRTPAEQRWIARLVGDGRLRKIGPRLYSSVPPGKTAAAVRASWTTVVAGLYPHALLSHRSAIEFSPTGDGDIFLTTTTNRVVTYPGLTLRFFRGPGPLADDAPFLTLHSSSLPRALLESLSVRLDSPAALPAAQLEERLDRLLALDGEGALQAVRDRAREIADQLGWDRAMTRLDQLVATLLGSRTGAISSARVQARLAGEPFSAPCLERLTLLFGELRAPLPDLRDPHRAPDHLTNKAFFDAYFSNYIEGTRFDIEEAEEIVFDHKLPARRPKDAHDILGTYQLVSDPSEMRRTPATFDDLLHLLRSRHATMLGRRPEAEPGTFKSRPNRAGDTQFIEPAEVMGTLRKGWELYRDLPPGLARAIFIMFLVTDVHPFVDGNGRIARVMMNAELTAADRSTIIVPTVLRDDYLQALRALTRRHRPAPLVQALVKAQRFSTRPFTPYPATLADLQRRNWFREPDDARLVD